MRKLIELEHSSLYASARSMDDDRLAFIEAIREQPDDDVPRLIFADWLDEQGDPHGEFIRTQCQLAQLTAADDPQLFQALKNREQELLTQHEATWAGEIAGKVNGYHFERGLIERLSLDVNTLVESGAEIIAATPGLATLRVSDVTDQVHRFIDLPAMQRVRRLLLTQYPLKVGDMRALAMSSQLQNLKALKLTGCLQTVGAFNALSKLKNVPQLNELALSGTHLGTEAFIKFATGPLITQIEQLELNNCNLTSEALESLLKQMPTERITRLILKGNSFGKRVMKRIAQCPKLEELDIRRCGNHSTGLSPLWEVKKPPRLKHLAIGNRNEIDHQLLAQLFNSPVCHDLTNLLLEVSLDQPGFRAMCDSEQLCSLRTLDIRCSKVTGDDLRYLAESGLMRNLNALYLGEIQDLKRLRFKKFVETAGWEKGSQRTLRVVNPASGQKKNYDAACRYLGIPTQDELW